MGASRPGGSSTSSTDWGIISLGGGETVSKTGKGFGGWRGYGQPEKIELRSVGESGFMIFASLSPREAGMTENLSGR